MWHGHVTQHRQSFLTLGIASAASFGAALAIVTQVSLIPGLGPVMVTGNAFVMALATAAVLFSFTRLRGVSTGVIYPIGIITALIGIPFFVSLILTARHRNWQ